MSEHDGELGCRVRERRHERGWTLGQLASESGLSKGYVSQIENGKSMPSGRKMLRLAAVLASSIDWLLTGEVPVGYREGHPIAVPRELANLAIERGWTFARVRALLEAREALIIRKPSSHLAKHAFTSAQWAELEERLRPYLEHDKADED